MKPKTRKMLMAGGLLIIAGTLPVIYKHLGVSDEVTFKLLDFIGSGVGLSLGSYLLGAGVHSKKTPPST